MTKRAYIFRELPDDVDSIGIVDLSNVPSDHVSDYMAAPESPIVLADGATVERIASLWRDLPDAPQERGHLPAFGLRFMRGGHRVLEATVCWACNSIVGSDELGSLHAGFDANHEVARQLFLELCDATTSWNRFIPPDGMSHPQVVVSNGSDWDHFEAIAALLAAELGGTWSETLSCDDERFWDLDTRGGKITLHMLQPNEMTIYPMGEARASVSSLALLKAAHRLVGPGRLG